MHNSIFLGVGANLTHERYGAPQQTLEAALVELRNRGVQTLRLSAWYRTAPVPPSDQPWYVNAVAEVASDLPADASSDSLRPQSLRQCRERFGRVEIA